MKKWNVAIIGLGFVGKLHYDALRRLPNVHVRTIVVHKAQDIPLVKENYDADVVTDCWQEAVADPQIQVIHNSRQTPSMTRSIWRPSGRGSTCTRKSP